MNNGQPKEDLTDPHIPSQQRRPEEAQWKVEAEECLNTT